MPRRTQILARVLVCLLACAAFQASAETTDAEARAALAKLHKTEPSAKLLSKKAVAVLVFPSIVKGGFMVGGAIGNGALMKKGKIVGHYNSVAASYGLQAGVQTYGYVLYFMNAKALKSLDETSGFEVGVGPSIVIMDEGKGKAMTNQTITQDIYAYIFGQQGLMAGMGIQGSKITKTK